MKGGGELAVAAMKGVAMFHVKRDGKVFGPFETAKLKEMATSGRLLPTDLISADGGVKWGYASKAKGLNLKPIETELPPMPKPAAAVRVEPTHAEKVKIATNNSYRTAFSALALTWVIGSIIGGIAIGIADGGLGGLDESIQLIVTLAAITGIGSAILGYIGMVGVGLFAVHHAKGLGYAAVFLLGMLIPFVNFFAIIMTIKVMAEKTYDLTHGI